MSGRDSGHRGLFDVPAAALQAGLSVLSRSRGGAWEGTLKERAGPLPLTGSWDVAKRRPEGIQAGNLNQKAWGILELPGDLLI